MDWEIRKIEKYFLTKKDPQYLYKNIEQMTPEELKEIVLYILNIYSLKLILYPKKNLKKS